MICIIILFNCFRDKKETTYPIIKWSDITIKEHLKRGAFGSVSLAVLKSGLEVAIKEFHHDM